MSKGVDLEHCRYLTTLPRYLGSAPEVPYFHRRAMAGDGECQAMVDGTHHAIDEEYDYEYEPGEVVCLFCLNRTEAAAFNLPEDSWIGISANILGRATAFYGETEAEVIAKHAAWMVVDCCPARAD